MSNSIEFQSAMNDFKVMFPDMDSEVIEEILRCNRGSVERTIDQLLSITSDNQNEKFMRDEPDLVTDITPKKQTSNPNPEVNTRTHKWKPVLLPLKPGFLRLNSDRTSDDYCDEFAVMLQNEEFLAELRFNQEFLSTLEKEEGRDERNFEERIKNMGKVSRKKFHQLAKIFTFQRKKSSSQKPKNSKLLEQESEDESKN